jgi:hypothetical protein
MAASLTIRSVVSLELLQRDFVSANNPAQQFSTMNLVARSADGTETAVEIYTPVGGLPVKRLPTAVVDLDPKEAAHDPA